LTDTRVYNKSTPRFNRKLLIGAIVAVVVVVVAVVAVINGWL
jgi:hypothetical protein